MGPIVVKSVDYEAVVENDDAVADRYKVVRRIKCPFCLHALDFIPHNADLWRHECPMRYGPVFFLNGYAISGASQYNYGEAEETRKKKKDSSGGGQGDEAR